MYFFGDCDSISLHLVVYERYIALRIANDRKNTALSDHSCVGMAYEWLIDLIYTFGAD